MKKLLLILIMILCCILWAKAVFASDWLINEKVSRENIPLANQGEYYGYSSYDCTPNEQFGGELMETCNRQSVVDHLTQALKKLYYVPQEDYNDLALLFKGTNLEKLFNTRVERVIVKERVMREPTEEEVKTKAKEMLSTLTNQL